MRTGQFEASLEEAKLYPQLWRLLLGLLFIGFMFVTSAALLVGLVVAAANAIDSMYMTHTTAALARLRSAAQGVGGIDTPLAVILLLVTFIGLFIGTMLAAAAFHFRGPGSLFGEPRDWFTGFATALAVLVPIYLGLVVLGSLFDTPEANLPLERWVTFLPFVIPLIFVQTASEELLFRGYLQQQLAARFTARWIWMGIPSVAFALLHWSPAVGPSLPFVIVSALIFALLAADLVEQTGNLGAAMGIHFGNNLFGMLGVAVGETVTGLALFVTPAPEDAMGPEAFGLILSMLVLVFVWWVIRRLLTR